MKKQATQVEINVNGTVDNSAIIAGSQNQVNISSNFATDKLASELAIRRLRQDIDELKYEREEIKNAGCLSLIFSNNCGILAIIAFVSLFLATIILSNIPSIGAGNTLWIAIGITFGIIIIAEVIDILSEKEAAQKRDTLDEILDLKYEELEKHERVVNNQ